MPQQRWAGSETFTPFRSSTATVALPVAGSLKSTLQVAKRATRACGGKVEAFRRSNQAEKVSRWKRGSWRSLCMPTTACMSARCGGSENAQLETGAVMLPSFPTSSVFPRNRSWRVTPLAPASAERERSISRGKSTCQRWGGV